MNIFLVDFIKVERVWPESLDRNNKEWIPKNKRQSIWKKDKKKTNNRKIPYLI